MATKIKDSKIIDGLVGDTILALYENVDESVEVDFMNTVFEFLIDQMPGHYDRLTELCEEYLSE